MGPVAVFAALCGSRYRVWQSASMPAALGAARFIGLLQLAQRC